MVAALRLVASTRPWTATAFLASYLVVGPVLFGVALAVVTTALALSLITVGLPLLVGAAVVVRGCAQVERRRALLVTGPIPAVYEQVDSPGLIAQITTRWSDRATRRDVIYLIAMFLPLLLLDLLALVAWLVPLAGVLLPLWYKAIPQNWDDGSHANGVALGYLPDGPHTTFAGPGYGIWVGDLRTALIVAAVFLVPVVIGALVVTGAAEVHVKLMRYLLGPYVDPLAPAKEFLRGPGLLPTG